MTEDLEARQGMMVGRRRTQAGSLVHSVFSLGYQWREGLDEVLRNCAKACTGAFLLNDPKFSAFSPESSTYNLREQMS